MKVKELIELLRKCDPELLVHSGYWEEDLSESNLVIGVIEAKNLSDEHDNIHGVYLRYQ